MSRLSLNYIFKNDLESTITGSEHRIGKNSYIFNISNPVLSFEYALTFSTEFLLL